MGKWFDANENVNNRKNVKKKKKGGEKGIDSNCDVRVDGNSLFC